MVNSNIKPIRSEQDYEAALARIDALMDAEPGTVEFDELDILADLVEAYENKHEPMGYPSPIAAIEFRMEQANLSPRDLIPFIGSRAKVSEVLSGKRAITMPMARALHEHLAIPAEVLLHKSSDHGDQPLANLEWSRFPLLAMAKLGWIPKGRDLVRNAEAIIQGLIERAGGQNVAGAVLYKKNDHLRANAKMDAYALNAWCWQVLAQANAAKPKAKYKRGTVTLEFLKTLARLSRAADGPRQSKALLAKHGIPLVIVPHLPKTYLDGAALRLGDGRPVIGLTLRYDRIDNFWFCLLHELAHVGRHLDHDMGDAFIDDLSLRDADTGREDSKERQADEWAEEALIPQTTWEGSAVRENPSPMAVMHLAHALEIHPAVVAGRVRHTHKNYRLLTQFVGSGTVRQQFDSAD